MDPKIILADEPTGDLDRNTADSVLALLSRLNQEFGKTILMVTHDEKAAICAQATVRLDKGQLERIEQNEKSLDSVAPLAGKD
jgi:putative ABC transport system ATP-binding protein